MAPKTDSEKKWFMNFWQQNEGRLLQYTARITGDSSTAQDIVQDAFIKLWKSEYEKVHSYLLKWLYRACRNAAIDYLRKEKRTENMDEKVFAKETFTESFINKNFLCKLLSFLPENHQEILILKFQQGFSYDEIAEVTGLSSSHIGVIIHNRLNTLREKAKQQGGE